MTNDLGDHGFSSNALWGISWLLALVTAASALRLAVYASEGERVQSELFVWLLVGCVAGAFSAACAVLAGVKNVERRLHRP